MEKRAFAVSLILSASIASPQTFAAVASPYTSEVSAALLNGTKVNAWSAPHWGFVGAPKNSKQEITSSSPKLSHSLVFDQEFDPNPVRPVPQLRMSSLQLKPSATQKTQRNSIPARTTITPTPQVTTQDIIDRVLPPIKTAARSAVADHLTQSSRAHFSITAPKGSASQVLVIDEDSLAFGEPKPLPGAVVHWISPFSGLSRMTDAKGYAAAPYMNTISTRFVVTMPGYLPALGYITAGTTTPIVMMKESRIGPVLQSLGVVPDPDRVLLIGKTLRESLAPADKITIDASLQSPFKVFYSIGSFGLFHTAAKETGTQGDFLVSGFERGLQYLMPSEASREWPAWIVDTSGLPKLVTTTLTDTSASTVQTQIVDSMALEKPPVGIHVTIGGQRGLFLPDEEGVLKLDQVHPRGSPDLLEVRADGYMKTWVNSVARADLFPPAISLFTQGQASDLLRSIDDMDFSKGIVFGNLRPEQFHRPVSVQVFNSVGKRYRDAVVAYFDDDNKISTELKTSDPMVQNFAIVNLPAGEWHVIIVDPSSGKGIGIQVVRVEDGTVTQVQF